VGAEEILGGFLGGGDRVNTERGGPSAETIHPRYYRDVNPGNPPRTVETFHPLAPADCDVRIDLALVVTARANASLERIDRVRRREAPLG